MQTLKSLENLISQSEYKDWIFRVKERADCFTLQVVFDAPDLITGKFELQRCRKWFISEHMTDNEVIRTVYLAVEIAEKHEMMEHFKFRGKRIANPHLDVIELSYGNVDFKNVDKREDNNINEEIIELKSLLHDGTGRAYPPNPRISKNWSKIYKYENKLYRIVGDNEHKEWEEVINIDKREKE